MDGKIGLEEAVAMIAKSEPMATVYRCMISGEFAPAPEEEIGENELVIGELTRVEKAILTARNVLADVHNKDHEEYTDIDPEKCGIFQASVDSLDRLFWASIRSRLGKATYDGNGIGLRKGYKIVSYKKEESDCGCGRMAGGIALFLQKR